MNIFSIITVSVTLLAMILSIIFDLKIKIWNKDISIYWVVCLIGAIVCLSFGLAGETPIKTIFFNSNNINPIKILVIFLSCTSISVLLDKIGFFSYFASIILQKSKSSQTKLFFSFSFVIAFLTIFTSNDILILTFTPFICYFAKNAKIDATPYILSEFVCANVWSMFFYIDNPTNIYMCGTFGISFLDYALKMAIPTIVCGIVSTLIVYLLFRKKLAQKIIVNDVEIIKLNKTMLTIGLCGLSLMVLFMTISNYIGIELWFAPLICSITTYPGIAIYAICKRTGFDILKKSLASLPYSLAPFLLSISVFIETLNNAGFIPEFTQFLSGQNMIVVGIIAFILGNILNNIPMTMLFTSTLAGYCATLPVIYGVVAASNICAILTPVGSLAGIMFMKILKNNDIEYNFLTFVKYGLIISIPILLIGLLLIAI